MLFLDSAQRDIPDTPRARTRWAQARRAETHYAIQLRKLARQIEVLITGIAEDQPPSMIEHMLEAYADFIEPWAKATAGRMLADVSRRDEVMWMQHARTMSRALAEEIKSTPTGQILRELMDQQVTLIKSLPLQAAKRVHEIALKGLEQGTRGEDIVAEIMRTGRVTQSRAELIARTETGRAASNLVEARARHIGVESYIWRSAEDYDVRNDHKELNGKVFTWDKPPIADKRSGARAHPGCIFNCRCYSEPILPEEI